jgi:hypothetical protein
MTAGVYDHIRFVEDIVKPKPIRGRPRLDVNKPVCMKDY